MIFETDFNDYSYAGLPSLRQLLHTFSTGFFCRIENYDYLCNPPKTAEIT